MEKHWYVVMTRTNSEFKVRDYFSVQSIENFLPLQTIAMEKNGKRVEKHRLVLPRMIFVRISVAEKSLVLNTMNVFGFLCYRSTSVPVMIPTNQMADFRYMLNYSNNEIVVSGERLPHGTPVVVCKGNLQGLYGELVRYENKYHILVRVDLLGCAMVSIPASYVKKLKKTDPIFVYSKV